MVLGCKVSPLVRSIFIGQNVDLTSGRDCIKYIITHLASFYCIPTGRHKSMSRPAPEGISHLQDAQDLVPGLGLAQDLVRPADEKSLPFLCMANALHKIWCVLQMRNQLKVNLTPCF